MSYSHTERYLLFFREIVCLGQSYAYQNHIKQNCLFCNCFSARSRRCSVLCASYFAALSGPAGALYCVLRTVLHCLATLVFCTVCFVLCCTARPRRCTVLCASYCAALSGPAGALYCVLRTVLHCQAPHVHCTMCFVLCCTARLRMYCALYSVLLSDLAHPGRPANCRNCSSWTMGPACAPIPVPSDDAFFQGQDRPACLPFTR